MPPLAFTSSRHISSAVLITLLGAAPAPVNARLSPILIGCPVCADALGKAIAPIAIAAAADRIAPKHQVAIAPSSLVPPGRRREPRPTPVHVLLARDLSLRCLVDQAVAHLTQAFDLGLHEVAGRQERVGALTDAAAGPTAEHVAGLEREHVRGVRDLLLGCEDELRGIAVLLDCAVDREANREIHVVADERARHQIGAHRGKVVVALAAEPIRTQRRPILADLQIAAGDVVRGHEARHVIERTLGLYAFAAPAYGERDLRLPIDLLHAAWDLDVVESAAQRARRLQE